MVRKTKICEAGCGQIPITINKEGFLNNSKCQPVNANLKLSGMGLKLGEKNMPVSKHSQLSVNKSSSHKSLKSP